MNFTGSIGCPAATLFSGGIHDRMPGKNEVTQKARGTRSIKSGESLEQMGAGEGH